MLPSSRCSTHHQPQTEPRRGGDAGCHQLTQAGIRLVDPLSSFLTVALTGVDVDGVLTERSATTTTDARWSDGEETFIDASIARSAGGAYEGLDGEDCGALAGERSM